jgi:ATP-dependent DNA helicase RecG
MDSPIRYIKGVGPKRERILNRLGIFTLRDLLYYFPVRYEDRRKVAAINSLKEGSVVLIKAAVVSVRSRRLFYRSKAMFEAILSDNTGSILSVWFNQPYLSGYIQKNNEYYFHGKVRSYKGRLQLVSPEFDIVDNDSYIRGVVPFYRLTYNLNQNTLRKLIGFCLDSYSKDVIEPIPYKIRNEYKLLNIKESLNQIHYPEDFYLLKRARSRFIFEEFFMAQILIYRRKVEFKISKRPALDIDQSLIERVKHNFGYELTPDQEKALQAILKDLSSSFRSSRFLQGDVGSGKTIVACISAFCVAAFGFQVAFMVPTEVLAMQHRNTLQVLAKGLNIEVELLTSSIKKKDKELIYKRLEKGEIDIIVGTHALLNQELKFKKLRMIIIDEQHRFGVSQRAALAHKGINSDILVMSATPIPRSLALTLYGDLEYSHIKEYPKGRKTPQTKIVKEKDRKKVYDFMRSKVDQGRQVFIVYALVEDSEESDLYSAVDMYQKLVKEFKGYRLGLLHGRLQSLEKQKVLEGFKGKDIDILVSTLVVEVGVDIPNATVMLIENPERFGAAQLHQLRGRIMRSDLQSYFFMMVKANISASSLERIKIVENINDGFKIAEQDLRLRGAGDLFGTIQSGFLPHRVANVQDDLEVLEAARKSAFKIIKEDPRLELKENKILKQDTQSILNESLFWQAS